MAFNHRSDGVRVSFDRFFAGFDDGLEAKRYRRASISSCFSGVRFAYGILPDVEAEKIESDIAVVEVEGMGDTRFAWFQFQAHVC